MCLYPQLKGREIHSISHHGDFTWLGGISEGQHFLHFYYCNVCSGQELSWWSWTKHQGEISSLEMAWPTDQGKMTEALEGPPLPEPELCAQWVLVVNGDWVLQLSGWGNDCLLRCLPGFQSLRPAETKWACAISAASRSSYWPVGKHLAVQFCCMLNYVYEICLFMPNS